MLAVPPTWSPIPTFKREFVGAQGSHHLEVDGYCTNSYALITLVDTKKPQTNMHYLQLCYLILIGFVNLGAGFLTFLLAIQELHPGFLA